jgi:hypothetical protein
VKTVNKLLIVLYIMTIAAGVAVTLRFAGVIEPFANNKAGKMLEA